HQGGPQHRVRVHSGWSALHRSKLTPEYERQLATRRGVAAHFRRLGIRVRVGPDQEIRVPRKEASRGRKSGSALTTPMELLRSRAPLHIAGAAPSEPSP